MLEMKHSQLESGLRKGWVTVQAGLSGNSLPGRPFRPASKCWALRFPSRRRRKRGREGSWTWEVANKKNFMSGRKRFWKHEVSRCLVCFCSLGGVLERPNGQCIKPRVYCHNGKGVYWNSYRAVIWTACRHAWHLLFSVRFPLRFSRI